MINLLKEIKFALQVASDWNFNYYEDEDGRDKSVYELLNKIENKIKELEQ